YAVGTKVTLIGENGRERITCEELAANLGGAGQEISAALTTRVTRIYID
ncbi:alanine racemase, partial [Paenibacillus sepulcri]|nr:alanine racemase [Paenibacillus sepulcri]